MSPTCNHAIYVTDPYGMYITRTGDTKGRGPTYARGASGDEGVGPGCPTLPLPLPLPFLLLL